MRFRLALQQPTRSSDGQGGGTMSWTTSFTAWADIEEKSAREINAADRLEGQRFFRAKIRYLSTVATITPNRWRATWDGRTFNITGVSYDARKQYATLELEERDQVQ